ncbi:hypothetical protein [Enterococcus faecalis]|uniref:hypothetical protein n=1 Tax=Enterococcus faecalis TaxID=1351 RepID=UPI003CE4C2C6
MTKHTPGPWSIGTPNDKEYGEIGVHGPGEYGFIICDLQADGYDEKTQKANASLICAAPDLLEALELLSQSAPAASCEMFHHEKQDRHTFIEECPALTRYEHACLKARAAIAKARGEA